MQRQEYFREYMEDFNTATLPHEKYVNLEKWEIAEYNRKCTVEEFSRLSIFSPKSIKAWILSPI